MFTVILHDLLRVVTDNYEQLAGMLSAFYGLLRVLRKVTIHRSLYVVVTTCLRAATIIYESFTSSGKKYEKLGQISVYISATDRARLNAVLKRCRRLWYLDDTDAVCVDELFQFADDKLVAKILHNSAHVLQPLIPDRPPTSYDLRPRSHDKLLLDNIS